MFKIYFWITACCMFINIFVDNLTYITLYLTVYMGQLTDDIISMPTLPQQLTHWKLFYISWEYPACLKALQMFGYIVRKSFASDSTFIEAIPQRRAVKC